MRQTELEATNDSFDVVVQQKLTVSRVAVSFRLNSVRQYFLGSLVAKDTLHGEQPTHFNYQIVDFLLALRMMGCFLACTAVFGISSNITIIYSRLIMI